MNVAGVARLIGVRGCDARRTGGSLVIVAMLSCPAWSETLPATGSAALSLQRVPLASLTGPGETPVPGDILRTTRIFPNWNLNCEVQLSKRHHLCAVEQTAIDAQGAAVLTWSIGMGANGSPALAFRTAADIDRSYGVHVGVGVFTMTLPVADGDCNPRTCLVAVALDATVRGAIASQRLIHFTLRRGGAELAVDGPVTGIFEALAAAKADPIGLRSLEPSKGRR